MLKFSWVSHENNFVTTQCVSHEKNISCDIVSFSGKKMSKGPRKIIENLNIFCVPHEEKLVLMQCVTPK